MKYINLQRNLFFSLISLFSILVVSGFTTLESISKLEKPTCDIFFQFKTEDTFAYSSIEDSNSDQYQINSPSGWSGTFPYVSGSLIFTVQLTSSHPAGTLILRNQSTATIIQTISVPANSTVVYLLNAGSSPNCNDYYQVSFE